MIEAKRKKFPRFSNRFEPVTNKFAIQIVQKTQMKPVTGSDTFVDTVFDLFSFFEDKNAVSEAKALWVFLWTEEFDSEAMTEDMKGYKSSNILQTIKDEQIRKIIYEHLLQRSCMFGDSYF